MIITGAIVTGARMVGEDTGASSAGDAYFNLVTLLLPGNGTNGAQNNTFQDSSTNALTVTRNGNTTQGTFSPFSQTGWSNYFDGSGDYLSFTKNTTTGSFTCECWFYRREDTGGGYHILFCGSSIFSANPDNVQLAVGNNGYVSLAMNGILVISNTGTAVTKNQWNHIAWVRSGTSCAIFVNGSRIATGTSSAALNVVSVGTYASTYEPNGYISNARIVNAAVYDPASTSITVPTAPLTAIANTYLLTCQSNRFIDNSTNAFAITVSGNTSVQAFSPFNPTAAYSTSTVGGSAYFDGTGDYLSVADNTVLDSLGDFTIEAWVYFNSVAGSQVIIDKGWAGTSYGSYLVFLTGGAVNFYSSSNGSSWSIASGFAIIASPIVGQWYHIAVTRSGASLKTFVNGVVTTTNTVTTAPTTNNTSVLGIGSSSAGTSPFTGYITDVRILKGTALYTAAFTPPTAPLTAITNTSVLLSCTNAGITDATAKNVLETVGNAQESTAQSKFGGSSMAFDGTGDYLTSPYNRWMRMANADFTIECWLRLAATQADMGIVSSYENNNGWFLRLGSNFIRFFAGNSEIVVDKTYSFSTNTWYHLAVTRSGTSIRMFVDGTQVGTTSTVGSATDTTTQGMFIGRTQTITNDLNGYINDLRITLGYARYTANFTPPTTAFSTQ